MELNEAIKILKEIRDVAKQNVTYIENNKLEVFLDINYKRNQEDFEAVNTVLNELDERYNKGYRDGFHSAIYDKYINEIHSEGESAVKYLAIEKAGYLRGYADGCKRVKDDEEEE